MKLTNHLLDEAMHIPGWGKGSTATPQGRLGGPDVGVLSVFAFPFRHISFIIFFDSGIDSLRVILAQSCSPNLSPFGLKQRAMNHDLRPKCRL